MPSPLRSLLRLLAGTRHLGRRTFHPRYLANRLLQGVEYLRGVAECRSRPNFLTLELTNHCNLRCTMCPRSRMTRPTGHMDFGLFRDLVDQAAPWAEVIDLDLYGEFALHPRWADMIACCRERGLFTVLNTNATLLDEATAEGLVGSGLDFLNLSFDSSEPELYERIRRGASFPRSLRNVRAFLARNRSIFTTVQMIHTVETADQVEAFRAFWRGSGVDRVRIKGYLHLDPQRGHLDPRPAPVSALPCLFLWKQLVVTQDGRVVPCCVDFDHQHVVGDARTRPLLEIWNGPAMQALRRQHARGRACDVGLCAPCRPLAYPAWLVGLGSLVDDATRRRILPDLEDLLEPKG